MAIIGTMGRRERRWIIYCGKKQRYVKLVGTSRRMVGMGGASETKIEAQYLPMYEQVLFIMTEPMWVLRAQMGNTIKEDTSEWYCVPVYFWKNGHGSWNYQGVDFAAAIPMDEVLEYEDGDDE